MKKILISVAMVLIAFGSQGEDLNEIFKRVNDFVAQKNYTKALDELGWAKKEIEKLNSGQVSAFFPDSLGGLTGDKFQSSSALGMNNAERIYKSGTDVEVKVSLTGAAGGGTEGMGALMGLGKMAAMMNVPGQESVRIQGKTATVNTENESSPQINIYLDSGSILNIESVSGASVTVLRKVADDMKLDELDKYLKGQSS